MKILFIWALFILPTFLSAQNSLLIGLDIYQARGYIRTLYPNFTEKRTQKSLAQDSDSIYTFKCSNIGSDGIREILLYYNNQNGVVCVRKYIKIEQLYKIVRTFGYGNYTKKCDVDADMGWQKEKLIYLLSITLNGYDDNGTPDLEIDLIERNILQKNRITK